MISVLKQHIHPIIFICLLMVVGWGQDCDGCNPGIDYYFDFEDQGSIECIGNISISDTSNIIGCNQNDLDILSNIIENNFIGEIEPYELGTQVWSEGRLIYLNCSNDSLSGQISPLIGGLTNLQYLYIHENQLTGQIPSEIGDLTNLIHLILCDNQLNGSIPNTIGNLTNLTSLRLYNNQLTGGIPYEIGNLLNLEILYLHNNQLTGEIPSEIGNLINLVGLFLNDNLLSGEIPETILNITNLRGIGLGGLPNGNQITSIPENIGVLDSLRYLDFTNNNLSYIPESIGELTNLWYLLLGGNQITYIPESIGQLSNLSSLMLFSNQLTSLPNTICDLNLNWDEDFSFNCGNNSICLESDIPECVINSEGFNFSLEWNGLEFLDSVTVVYQPQNCDENSISEFTLPTQYTLNQPFPNPFNPTTSISFSIPEQSQTSLKIYDIKGNLISTLLNQTMNVGHHQIEWNGENISSGTYFIRINSGEFSDVKKVVLVK